MNKSYIKLYSKLYIITSWKQSTERPRHDSQRPFWISPECWKLQLSSSLTWTTIMKWDWLQLFPEQCTQTATISIRINAQSCVLCWQSISEECLHYERRKLWFITGPQDCICTVRLNIQVVSEAEDRETNIGPTVLFVLKTTDTHGGWWSQPSLKLSAGNQVEITPGWIPWVGMFR